MYYYKSPEVYKPNEQQTNTWNTIIECPTRYSTRPGVKSGTAVPPCLELSNPPNLKQMALLKKGPHFGDDIIVDELNMYAQNCHVDTLGSPWVPLQNYIRVSTISVLAIATERESLIICISLHILTYEWCSVNNI